MCSDFFFEILYLFVEYFNFVFFYFKLRSYFLEDGSLDLNLRIVFVFQ